ncbi:MAG: ATP-binding protein [Phycisphaerales bacterium]|nr:ATP-binding protein [Phycisphaerales bacterium]
MSDPNTHVEGARPIELAHDREAISTLIETLLDQAEKVGYGSSAIFAIRLAIEEAITNAFEHGHEGLSPDLTISVEYRVSPQIIEIAIEDQGPGFSPEALPDPTLLENLSKPSGRGVMLMKAYMSEVDFNSRGNRVRMRYFNPGS